MMTAEKPATEPQVELPFEPNTLVSYHGGGYDGCFWEWNYAYIDAERQFHNIVATGRHGCETLEKLLTAWATRPDEFDLYGLSDPDEVLRASNVLPVDHLLGLAKWYHEHQAEVQFRPKCDCCEKRFNAAQGKGDGLFCPGGVVLNFSKVVCQKCYDLYRCAYCGEFVGEGNMARDKDPDNDTGYCIWCWEEHPNG